MAPAKRHAYEAGFKLQAIAHAVKHGNRDAGRKFKVSEVMVRKWRKQENELRQAKKTTKSFRGRKARWPQLEDKIEDWVVEQNAAGRIISTLDIRKKATAFARSMNISEFKGNSPWCDRFMKRKNICIDTRTVVSKRSPRNFRAKLTTSSTCHKSTSPQKVIEPEDIDDTIPSTVDVLENPTVEEPENQIKSENLAVEDTITETDLEFSVISNESTDELPPQNLSMSSSKRQGYDIDFKLKAIAHAVKHGNRDTARKFKVSESVIRTWRKQENDLQVKKTTRSFQGSKARRLQLEEKVASPKKHGYDAEFKLKVISHAVKHGNRGAARKFKVHESSIRAWRQQENGHHEEKKITPTFQGKKARRLRLENKTASGKRPSVYDAEFKLKAIAHAVKHGNRGTARKFKINESMVRKWRKLENSIRQVQTTRSQRWPQLEDEIERWAIEQYEAGRKISALDIRKKATALAESMDIDDFNDDGSWCIPFMQRRNICASAQTTVTTASEQSPKNLEVKPTTSSRRRKSEFPQKMIQTEHIDDVIPSTVDETLPENTTVEKTEPPTNSETAIIPSESTNELHLPDVDVSEVKVELRTALEYWMTKCEQSFIASGGHQEVNYSTICQWIVDAWANLSPSTVVQAFMKAGIITKLQCKNEDTESKKEERNLRVLDTIVTQLLNSDAKQEESEGV